LTLLIPPLRERLEELPALIATELKAAALKEGKNIAAIHPEAMEKLLNHKWRGNLRELSHTARTMTLFCNGSVILPENVVFPPDLESHFAGIDNAQTASMRTDNHQEPERHADFSLNSAIKRHIRFVYEQVNRSQRQAAKLLGISRSTLARYLREPR
jgi:DNA-binding NtrC family response regulator